MSEEYVTKELYNEGIKRIEQKIDSYISEIRQLNEASEARHEKITAEIRAEVKEIRGEVKTLDTKLDGAIDSLTVAINDTNSRIEDLSNRLNDIFNILSNRSAWFSLIVGISAVIIAGVQVYLALKP